jgi:K+-transporting ATPase A subunit
MMTWVRSSKGAVTLSFAALLSLLARSYADMGFEFPGWIDHFGMGVTPLWILGWTAIAGGWIWALLRAVARGGRGTWMILFVYALLTGLGSGLASLLAFANFAAYSVFWLSLAAGALAAVAAAFQLWGARK